MEFTKSSIRLIGISDKKPVLLRLLSYCERGFYALA